MNSINFFTVICAFVISSGVVKSAHVSTKSHPMLASLYNVANGIRNLQTQHTEQQHVVDSSQLGDRKGTTESPLAPWDFQGGPIETDKSIIGGNPVQDLPRDLFKNVNQGDFVLQNGGIGVISDPGALRNSNNHKRGSGGMDRFVKPAFSEKLFNPIKDTPLQISDIAADMMCSLCQQRGNATCIAIYCWNDAAMRVPLETPPLEPRRFPERNPLLDGKFDLRNQIDRHDLLQLTNINSPLEQNSLGTMGLNQISPNRDTPQREPTSPIWLLSDNLHAAEPTSQTNFPHTQGSSDSAPVLTAANLNPVGTVRDTFAVNDNPSLNNHPNNENVGNPGFVLPDARFGNLVPLVGQQIGNFGNPVDLLQLTNIDTPIDQHIGNIVSPVPPIEQQTRHSDNPVSSGDQHEKSLAGHVSSADRQSTNQDNPVPLVEQELGNLGSTADLLQLTNIDTPVDQLSGSIDSPITSTGQQSGNSDIFAPSIDQQAGNLDIPVPTRDQQIENPGVPAQSIDLQTENPGTPVDDFLLLTNINTPVDQLAGSIGSPSTLKGQQLGINDIPVQSIDQQVGNLGDSVPSINLLRENLGAAPSHSIDQQTANPGTPEDFLLLTNINTSPDQQSTNTDSLVSSTDQHFENLVSSFPSIEQQAFDNRQPGISDSLVPSVEEQSGNLGTPVQLVDQQSQIVDRPIQSNSGQSGNIGSHIPMIDRKDGIPNVWNGDLTGTSDTRPLEIPTDALLMLLLNEDPLFSGISDLANKPNTQIENRIVESPSNEINSAGKIARIERPLIPAATDVFANNELETSKVLNFGFLDGRGHHHHDSEKTHSFSTSIPAARDVFTNMREETNHKHTLVIKENGNAEKVGVLVWKGPLPKGDASGFETIGQNSNSKQINMQPVDVQSLGSSAHKISHKIVNHRQSQNDAGQKVKHLHSPLVNNNIKRNREQFAENIVNKIDVSSTLSSSAAATVEETTTAATTPISTMNPVRKSVLQNWSKRLLTRLN